MTKFLMKYLQCRFGIHWVKLNDITAAHTCPYCGEYFPKLTWPRE